MLLACKKSPSFSYFANKRTTVATIVYVPVKKLDNLVCNMNSLFIVSCMPLKRIVYGCNSFHKSGMTTLNKNNGRQA